MYKTNALSVDILTFQSLTNHKSGADVCVGVCVYVVGVCVCVYTHTHTHKFNRSAVTHYSHRETK